MEYKACESAPVGGALLREFPRIGIVLLAAGQSRRMGTNKQLLLWRGKTVLDAVCHALQTGWIQSANGSSLVNYPFVAVTNDNRNIDEIVKNYGFSVVHNENPELGQGASIALGIQYLLSTYGRNYFDGIICSVSDQPLLCPKVIETLIQYFQQRHDADNRIIVVPKYGFTQHAGNPVMFGNHWFDALQTIEGDQGGRTIICGEGQDFIKYVYIASDWGDDVDTPEDYNDLLNRESEGV